MYLNEEVIKQYSPYLSRLCFFLCQNENDANDVFQETWIKVIRHIDKYDEDRKFENWASTICVNTYRDMYRKNKKLQHVEFSDNNMMDSFFDSLPDTNNEVHTRDEYLGLYHAIGALTIKMRTVVILFYFSGYSEKECAKILGVSANKIKSRLYSARQLLKRSLEQ
jgi:RNA polymerase sigma-70 factor (ECF subfamily)